MSRSCVQCSAVLEEATAFCISCGTKVEDVVVSPTSHEFIERPFIQTDGSSNSPINMIRARAVPVISQMKEKWVGARKVPIALVVVLIVMSVLAAAVGGRLSIDQESIRAEASEAGYADGFRAGRQRGDADGYERGSAEGYRSGYSAGETFGFQRGKEQGCRDAFVFLDGTFQHITPYDPIFRRMRGGYYKSRSNC